MQTKHVLCYNNVVTLEGFSQYIVDGHQFFFRKYGIASKYFPDMYIHNALTHV